MSDKTTSFRVRLYAKHTFVRLLARLKFNFSYVFSLMNYYLRLSRVCHIAIFTFERFLASMESLVGLKMTNSFEGC